jgi:Xaa-Pro aminopeptidase
MIPTDRMETALGEAGLDLLVASTVENVYYTAGTYSVATKGLGEHAFSLWTPDGGPYLVMPARETSSLLDNGVEPAGVYPYGATNIYRSDSLSAADERVLELQEAREFDDPVVALATAVEELTDGPAVAIERAGFDPDEFARLEDELGEYDLETGADVLHDLRRVKTDEEVGRLRRSAEITETSMEEAMAALEPGMTERELANDFRARVCEKGGEPLFLTVGFGERTAYTHPLPGDREIREGDLVRWDGGCTYESYCSDVGRTYAFRSADPDAEQKYAALYAGLEAALGQLRGGVEAGRVYEAGVGAVRESGVDALAGFDPFHLGHGIGVEIYDPPTIVPGAGQLSEGMVMCVEPPYNELGRGGFLIEDEVLVTDEGVETLTDAAPTLPVVD